MRLCWCTRLDGRMIYPVLLVYKGKMLVGHVGRTSCVSPHYLVDAPIHLLKSGILQIMFSNSYFGSHVCSFGYTLLQKRESARTVQLAVTVSYVSLSPGFCVLQVAAPTSHLVQMKRSRLFGKTRWPPAFLLSQKTLMLIEGITRQVESTFNVFISP